MFVRLVITFAFCVPDVSQAVLITQWPHYISSLPSGPAKMHCYQNDTDYQYLYWYKQLRGESFQLIVSIVAGGVTFEEGFKSGFEAETSKEKQWSLTIPSVQKKDEAVYLCAASLHSAAADLSAGTKTNSREAAGCSHTWLTFILITRRKEPHCGEDDISDVYYTLSRLNSWKWRRKTTRNKLFSKMKNYLAGGLFWHLNCAVCFPDKWPSDHMRWISDPTDRWRHSTWYAALIKRWWWWINPQRHNTLPSVSWALFFSWLYGFSHQTQTMPSPVHMVSVLFIKSPNHTLSYINY